MKKPKKYTDFLIIGWNGNTILDAVVLDAFASTGNGKLSLEAARQNYKGRYERFTLHKTTARIFG